MNAFIIHGGLLLLAYLSAMFAVVIIKKDRSIGNFTWGGGVALLGLYTLIATGTYLPRHLLATTLIMIWCARLAFYVYSRYKKGADPRYVAWVNQRGLTAHLLTAGWIFVLNGGMAIIMALPIMIINTSSTPGLDLLDWCAFITWWIGYACEAVADYQLSTFIKNPENKSKIMDTGLWRYSRHPNYFGEIVMWWSIFLIALSTPFGLISIIAPMAITISLCFVTGIPWNEAVFANNPAYQAYKKRTSVLIPWFVKK